MPTVYALCLNRIKAKDRNSVEIVAICLDRKKLVAWYNDQLLFRNSKTLESVFFADSPLRFYNKLESFEPNEYDQGILELEWTDVQCSKFGGLII